MIQALTPAALAELVATQSSPCLSLYLPTHRHRPDNQQDPIRYRNLLKRLETSLKQHPDADGQALLAPLLALADNADFWNHTQEGLAVLSAKDRFRVFRLQREVPELAIVANSFHTKPLRRYLQSADRYQVLGLSRHRIQLFEGNRDVLDELDPASGVPLKMTDALGEEVTDPRHTVSSYGGANGAMHHGHGGKKDEVDLDAERYFRAVDRAITEHHSKPSGLPLMLAALPEHHHLFRKVSHNALLMDEGLHANPEGMPLDTLRKRAWAVAEPQHRAQQAALIETFSSAQANGLGNDHLTQVAKAAVEGRIDTLIIESGRQIAGHLDRDTGHIDHAELADPTVDDLLDDLGEVVEAMGGNVQVLPKTMMPGSTGIAAMYRH